MAIDKVETDRLERLHDTQRWEHIATEAELITQYTKICRAKLKVWSTLTPSERSILKSYVPGGSQ